jgi:5-methylcytosine-specific restriction protein B
MTGVHSGQRGPFMPDAGLLTGSKGDGYIDDDEGGVINLRALLDAMNQRIRFMLNRDMTQA